MGWALAYIAVGAFLLCCSKVSAPDAARRFIGSAFVVLLWPVLIALGVVQNLRRAA